MRPAAFFYYCNRLNGMQVPVVLEVGDGVFELLQLALFTGHENIDVFRIDVLGHDFAVVQLAQCITQVVRQALLVLLVAVAFDRSARLDLVCLLYTSPSPRDS